MSFTCALENHLPQHVWISTPFGSTPSEQTEIFFHLEDFFFFFINLFYFSPCHLTFPSQVDFSPIGLDFRICGSLVLTIQMQFCLRSASFESCLLFPQLQGASLGHVPSSALHCIYNFPSPLPISIISFTLLALPLDSPAFISGVGSMV